MYIIKEQDLKNKVGKFIKMKALSIVYPHGTNIALGKKTIEVRSWLPPIGFNEDLLIIENHNYLHNPDDVDPEGKAVAIVRIKQTRDFLESDIPLAMASRWDPGYYSWELTDVRAIDSHRKIEAKREIYDIEIDFDLSL